MIKILIFGNSGSGKSTLAKTLCKLQGGAHLDLDSIAWENTIPPTRKALNLSENEIQDFINLNSSWVIEGCYTDEIIFMNLSIKECISNARSRPWEPHKYKSKQEQDNNLEMLIDWISKYNKREDTFSMTSHQNFYNNFKGKKRSINSNEWRSQPIA